MRSYLVSYVTCFKFEADLKLLSPCSVAIGWFQVNTMCLVACYNTDSLVSEKRA